MFRFSPKKRYATVCIGGMRCASCELLLERKLGAVPGVKHVDVDQKNGIARITAHKTRLPRYEHIVDVIERAGYSVVNEDDPSISAVSSGRRKWMEIAGTLLIIVAAYKLLHTFDIVSLAPSTSGALSIGGIFLIGLVAGTSSCLAVTGGLLLALASKHNDMHQAETPWQKFTPLLHFNLGRLVSYLVLGGLVGFLGQSITLNTSMSGYMNIILAVVMFYIALTILDIIPKGSFPIRPPKKLSRWISNLSESGHPAAPFSMGVLTFFLPCGFTQSLQLAALASGSFLTGGVMMFVFALGTLPSLLGISAISSMATGKFSRLFLRFSGALVLVLAVVQLSSGIALTGFDLSRVVAASQQEVDAVPRMNGNVQELFMVVTPNGYEPRNLTINAGVPVRWTIDGSGASGCTSVLTIPSLNIYKPLRQGENIIEFTVTQKGHMVFMCAMGMVRGSITVI